MDSKPNIEAEHKGSLLTIDWIRHGYSCVNVMFDLGENKIDASNIDKKNIENAVLSDAGIRQAKQAKRFLDKNNIKYDLIVSSELKRTIRTASIISGGSLTTYVCPYLVEIIENNKLMDFGSIRDLEKYSKKISALNIDFSILKEYKSINDKKVILPSAVSFFNKILPLLLQKIDKTKNIRICIASHQNFMQQYFKEKYNINLLVNNTDIWSETVLIDQPLKVYTKPFNLYKNRDYFTSDELKNNKDSSNKVVFDKCKQKKIINEKKLNTPIPSNDMLGDIYKKIMNGEYTWIIVIMLILSIFFYFKRK